MATQDFALSYTVEIPALFNDPPEGGQGPAGTIFADVVLQDMQGPAGTLFGDVVLLDMQGPAGTLNAATAILAAVGATVEFNLSGLCHPPNEMGAGPPGASTLSADGIGGGQTSEASCP